MPANILVVLTLVASGQCFFSALLDGPQKAAYSVCGSQGGRAAVASPTSFRQMAPAPVVKPMGGNNYRINGGYNGYPMGGYDGKAMGGWQRQRIVSVEPSINGGWNNGASGETEESYGSWNNGVSGETEESYGSWNNGVSGETEESYGSWNNGASGETEENYGSWNNGASGETEERDDSWNRRQRMNGRNNGRSNNRQMSMASQNANSWQNMRNTDFMQDWFDDSDDVVQGEMVRPASSFVLVAQPAKSTSF